MFFIIFARKDLNMIQRFIIIFLFIGIIPGLFAQDVVQIMQYNLLNYGNLTAYCTSTNNGALTKNANFKIIFNHVKPDILTVNEMAENPIYQDSLLNNTLNIDGETKYKRATLTDLSKGNWIVNMLYYNSEKFGLSKHIALPTIYRATDVYRLYYKAADLAITNDTVFLTCIVTHLKAGSYSSDQTDRTTMVNTIMNYIQTNDLRNNYLLMGDFNVQSASETAYTNLLKEYSGTYFLNDPLNASGTWNNNSNFSAIHTQSPRQIANGCASTGGLDDRFDFILSSPKLLEGNHGMKLLSETYTALGNDGLHFDRSILLDPTNTSAPADVITALHDASDHLPVLVKIRTDQSYLSIESEERFEEIKFQNPVNDQLQIHLAFENAHAFEIRILDLMGRTLKVFPNNAKAAQHSINIDFSDLKSGIYFLQINMDNGKQSIHKILKN